MSIFSHILMPNTLSLEYNTITVKRKRQKKQVTITEVLMWEIKEKEERGRMDRVKSEKSWDEREREGEVHDH